MKYNELQQKVHSIHIVADFLICQRYPTQDSSFMIATEGASDGFGAKLGKDANVTTDLLMKICTGLDCNLNDICETVPINEE